jgi:ABC-2 type transport system permease protein
LSILTRDIQMITNAAFSILLVLAGVEIPIDRLPTFLSKISYILPMSRSTRAVDVLLSGSSNYNTLLIGELIVGLFYMIVALGVYSYVERASRKNATLDFY